MSGKRSRGLDVVEERAVKSLCQSGTTSFEANPFIGSRGPNRSPRWIANKKYRDYLFKCEQSGVEPTLERDDFLVYPDVSVAAEEPVVDDEIPTVIDQKAERKAVRKARKSEMKALFKAGGEPEIKNDSDRKLWEKVKAKAVPVVSDYEEEDEFEGFGDDVEPMDDDSGPTDFSYTDDGAFEPEQPVDDEQAQAPGIASERDENARPVVNDEMPDIVDVDSDEEVLAAGTASNDALAANNVHEHDYDHDIYELVPDDYICIKEKLVAYVDDDIYLARHGYDSKTASNTMFPDCSHEHHRLQLYQSFATEQNRRATEKMDKLAGSWDDVRDDCIPLHKLGITQDQKNTSTVCSVCNCLIKASMLFSRLLCSLTVPDDQKWRLVLESSNRAPIYQTSHRCNFYQGSKVCCNSKHLMLETTTANNARKGHHNGRYGCYDKTACIGALVCRLRPGLLDDEEAADAAVSRTRPGLFKEVADAPATKVQDSVQEDFQPPTIEGQPPVVEDQTQPNVVSTQTAEGALGDNTLTATAKNFVLALSPQRKKPAYHGRTSQACIACSRRKTRVRILVGGEYNY
ncbi:hypothetical protein LTR15_008618 [Elasticomyces elasticus]|nr:hypothetical protein LTR15_008618 [Elasticomyces elasticus]